MAISGKDIKLDVITVFGGKPVYLTGVRDWFEYNNGERGSQKGFVYEVASVNLKLEKIRVKIAGPLQLEAPENGDMVQVDFENFVANFYVGQNNRLELSAQADKILEVQN